MQPKNTIIIVVHRQTEADQQVVEILRQELQNRGVQDICTIAEENQQANSSPEQRAAAVIKEIEEKIYCLPDPRKRTFILKKRQKKSKKDWKI